MTEYDGEPWVRQHARENPGHTTTERIDAPPHCQTCGALPPLYDDLVDLSKMLESVPPLPSRIDVSTSVLEVLRSKAEAAGVVITGTNPLFGIPVVEDPSLAPGEWKIVPSPQIGDPCARCGKPTSHNDVLLTATHAFHVFCPTDSPNEHKHP